jgi:hypothetical protein
VYHFISYTHDKHILRKIIRDDSFHLLTDLFELIAVMSVNVESPDVHVRDSL